MLVSLWMDGQRLSNRSERRYEIWNAVLDVDRLDWIDNEDTAMGSVDYLTHLRSSRDKCLNLLNKCAP